MPMTREEFVEAVNVICPHCRRGLVPRYRPETNEFAHVITGGSFSSSPCFASGLRLSHFNPDYKESPAAPASPPAQ